MKMGTKPVITLHRHSHHSQIIKNEMEARLYNSNDQITIHRNILYLHALTVYLNQKKVLSEFL